MATPLSSSPPPPSSASPSEELQKDQETQQKEQGTNEFMYKTKAIQFLGRTTPIILQNDNGPCPLLAICNVLLLRNNLNLNPDSFEVSQERLLSLIAERLIDSNSNVNNKDEGYVENQQQNIADAIDLLPRLATGIDVNIKFRRMDDFEFTRECAIFDLLDIPLYHGWIVDPQDLETANAIGSKSYNALMGELVALETQNVEVQRGHHSGEDSVDFAAATTAALGVPSPCLSKTRSLDDSLPAVAELCKLRKGDLEEEAELLMVLKLSENQPPASVGDSHVVTTNGGSVFVISDVNKSSEEDVLADSQDAVKGNVSCESESFNQLEYSISDDKKALNNAGSEHTCTKINQGEEVCSTSKADGCIDQHQSCSQESEEQTTSDGALEKSSKQKLMDGKTSSEMHYMEKTIPESTTFDNSIETLSKTEDEKVGKSTPATTMPEPAEKISGDDTVEVSGSTVVTATPDTSSRSQHVVFDALNSSIDGNEPIYEGEECINSRSTICEDREPVYEGEAALAEKADKNAVDSSKARATDGLAPEQGELIRNFLRTSASQLTFYGLFCLQGGLKERELCVFFRNNHFSTMFKYEGELYLLATDQGYLNQPDLVWEKLNEVNGDTLFMTGNFKEFKVDGNTNGTWDEHNAVTSTADYLSSINSASEAGIDINPDLQLAIALQQQEFEQQPPRNMQPPSSVGASRLVTGPQGPRSSARPSASSSSKVEGKSSKDKCTLM